MNTKTLIFCWSLIATTQPVHPFSLNPIKHLNRLNDEMWELTIRTIVRLDEITTEIEYEENHFRPIKDEGVAKRSVKIDPSSRSASSGLRKKAVRFSDIAGIEPIVDEMREIVDYLRNAEKYERLGAKVAKGVLLEGPPGVGKTTIARALANEADCEFFYASGSEFVRLYVGQGAEHVRQLFDRARAANGPAIIFIDEIDAVGGERGDSGNSGSREYDQTVNELLTQMQGFRGDEPIVVLAATNRADKFDPALKRPGRFTRIISIPLPDETARREILELYVNKLPRVDRNTVPLDELAETTQGFTGAELEDLVNCAALAAVRGDAVRVGREHFRSALRSCSKAKPSRKPKTSWDKFS